jgi:hypothetical protein
VTTAAAASDGSPIAVPEPSTLLLVGTGLLGLGITVRRRVRARPQ